jgi:DeoR family fructose operon transcriptional repressor
MANDDFSNILKTAECGGSPMYRNERFERIMELLQKNGYMTVKQLTEALDYSTAMVNRDLNSIEEKHLVRRSYGTVMLAEQKVMPLVLRYRSMEKAKSALCRRAADLVRAGDVIFIDGSTTTEGMGRYLLDKEDIRVITNNVALFLFLSEHGVDAVILGGNLLEPPYFLGGCETEGSAMRYHADKAFFSALRITKEGEISADAEYETLRRIMVRNSDASYFIGDSEKVYDRVSRRLFLPDEISGIISDYPFSDAVRAKYPETEFLI